MRVWFTGKVIVGGEGHGGFRLAGDADPLLRTSAWEAWVPPTASYEVVAPPRPYEVMLLACGHISQKKRPSEPAEHVFCTLCMCKQPLEAIGSVNW